MSPPEALQRSRVDHVLDYVHQRAFERAVLNAISTPVTEETFAQIVDGLPLSSVAWGTQDHRVLLGDPVDNHLDICPGALEKTKQFKANFNALDLEISSDALQRYQDIPVGSRASKMPFLELIVATIHSIAAHLFKLADGGFHKNAVWPSDDAYEQEYLAKRPPPFSLLHYSKQQYPDGMADMAGYWAEDRIFGGVVLFGRGNEKGYDGIWFHSHRYEVTKRIYKLTGEQSERLFQLLEREQTEASSCPLPILGDINNRERVDEEIAIPEFNIYRDRWERAIEYKNWSDYGAQRHCCRNDIDWPELLDLSNQNRELQNRSNSGRQSQAME
ncbi:hypothetical protein KVR01_007328 [Diaporthe batatas]|uniref:uncharacterized protein n=1 Tax=Diaporthe batatas TaxID=748121 RepID=UPI001D036F28|nr:uncharacterized protein KVR01_007328 [Diaporthe batatas]KAG8162850.1 hypothetical protein KVR01_007328 [Diaporthe batatas]